MKQEEIRRVADIIAPYFNDPIDIPCCYCEAAKAILTAGYMCKADFAQQISGHFSNRFEKMVCGAIQDTVNTHSVISDETKSSLAKRITRQILQVIKQG